MYAKSQSQMVAYNIYELYGKIKAAKPMIWELSKYEL